MISMYAKKQQIHKEVSDSMAGYVCDTLSRNVHHSVHFVQQSLHHSVHFVQNSEP